MSLSLIPNPTLPKCLNFVKIHQFHDPKGSSPGDFRPAPVSWGHPSCTCPSPSVSWGCPGPCTHVTSLCTGGLGIITKSLSCFCTAPFRVASWGKGGTFIQLSCLIDSFSGFKFGSYFPSEFQKFCCVVFNFHFCYSEVQSHFHS